MMTDVYNSSDKKKLWQQRKNEIYETKGAVAVDFVLL